MKRIKNLMITVLVIALLFSCCMNVCQANAEEQSVVPTELPQVTEQPIVTPEPTIEPTVVPTVAPTPKPTKKPKSIKKYKKIKILHVSRVNATMPVRVNTPYALHVSIQPAKANHKAVKWVSSNKHYAKVSSKGVVTAKQKGLGKTVAIYVIATDGSGKKEKITLTILPKINKKGKMIAITYDDGPRAESSSKILDALKENNAVATFFTLGGNLSSAANQKVVKRSFDYGNEIASHTFSHKDLLRLTDAQIKSEVAKTDAVIRKITGVNPRLVRPPYGAINDRVAKALGKPSILWSIDTLDWQTLSASSTYQSVVSSAHNGSIALMHEIYDSTAAAAGPILKDLKKKGFQFVTVSELFKYKGKKLKSGKRYCNA